MLANKVITKYLSRYAEADLPAAPTAHWHDVLVLPAYRENPALLRQISDYLPDSTSVLVILVLNRPASDGDRQANAALRLATEQLGACEGQPHLHPLQGGHHVYLMDLETRIGPIPDSLGVGLARKQGSDLALAWQQTGCIESPWIAQTDADAILPSDYFERLNSASGSTVTFPFYHGAGPSEAVNAATQFYELRLHDYVLQLERAGSPWAWHALGSCMAVHRDAYAGVRGFPRRAGGEDFYLLAKTAKLGTLNRLGGHCTVLESRESSRVPFGTGPAVSRLLGSQDDLIDVPLFYARASFIALAACLQLPDRCGALDLRGRLSDQLAVQLPEKLARQTALALAQMNIDRLLAHCEKQGLRDETYRRHFHEWLDAFRTLKLLHLLRDAGHEDRSLRQLSDEQHIWPGDYAGTDPAHIGVLCRQHWGWRVGD